MSQGGDSQQGGQRHRPIPPFPPCLSSPSKKRKKEKKKKGADTYSSYAPKANSLGSIVTTLRLSGWAEFPFIEKAIATKENRKKRKKKEKYESCSDSGRIQL